MSYDETVAPHAGAWIETNRVLACLAGRPVSRLTQARGLKLTTARLMAEMPESRLTQARGLKRPLSDDVQVNPLSRLTQARGLKRPPRSRAGRTGQSRLTQARGLKLWVLELTKRGRPHVAPHAGAWIETRTIICCLSLDCWSRLTQARGLKPASPSASAPRRTVAPHAGAWIETSPRTRSRSRRASSRLTQARGLKRLLLGNGRNRPQSRLTQARGLKPMVRQSMPAAPGVAPHAGAWIETNTRTHCSSSRE